MNNDSEEYGGEVDRTRRLPCGHCDGYAEYEGGMVRINDEPACQDCVDELTNWGGDDDE